MRAEEGRGRAAPRRPPHHPPAPLQAAPSEAASIFIRERAIGVALEGVRCVICAGQVVILGVPPPHAAGGHARHAHAAAGPPLPAAPFVRDLVGRVAGGRCVRGDGTVESAFC